MSSEPGEMEDGRAPVTGIRRRRSEMEEAGQGEGVEEDAPAHEGNPDKMKLLQLASLPPHLLHLQVFKRLPLLNILHLRLLCKSWYSRLCSIPFLHAWSCHAARPSGERWLVVGDATWPSDPRLLAHDPCSNRWLTLPLHFPEPCWLGSLFGFSPGMHLAADSSGGLVCTVVLHYTLIGRDDGVEPLEIPPRFRGRRFYILVFNPITGQTKALPELPVTMLASLHIEHIRQLSLTMIATPTTSHYHVILSHHPFQYMCGMWVYDSRTDMWNLVTMSTSSPHVGNTILEADLFEWDDKKSLVYGYNMQMDTWCEVPGPCQMEALLHDTIPLIFIYKGRLLFASLISSGYVANGFSVWEFQPCSGSNITSSWVLVAQTPHNLCKPAGSTEEHHFNELQHKFKLICSGSRVCLTFAEFFPHLKGMDYPTSHQYSDVYSGIYCPSLTYDLDQKSWSRLPPHPEVGLLFTGGFSFQPSFTAIV